MPGENLLPGAEPTGLEHLPGYWLGRAAIRRQVAAEAAEILARTRVSLPDSRPGDPEASPAHTIPHSASGLIAAAVRREVMRNMAVAREYEERAANAARA